MHNQLESNSSIVHERVRNIKEFIDERSETPKYICVCCEGLFFHNSVFLVTEKERNDLAPNYSMFSTKYICSTCRKQHKQNRLPTLAVKNGLEYPIQPDCLKILSKLEQRFLSPFINFMQLRDLTPYALNPQLGIKGSVVNIPVSVPEMVKQLPRSASGVNVLQVKLKRRLEHISNYMHEIINTKNIAEALKFLMLQELYKLYNITLDEYTMAQYEQNEENINFIVNSDDANVFEEVAKEKDSQTSISKIEKMTEGVKSKFKTVLNTWLSIQMKLVMQAMKSLSYRVKMERN